MAVKAYVLVETEAALTQESVAEVRKMAGVTSVESVIGPCDIVVAIEADTMEGMTSVLREIRSASGVSRTTTLIRLK